MSVEFLRGIEGQLIFLVVAIFFKHAIQVRVVGILDFELFSVSRFDLSLRVCGATVRNVSCTTLSWYALAVVRLLGTTSRLFFIVFLCLRCLFLSFFYGLLSSLTVFDVLWAKFIQELFVFVESGQILQFLVNLTCESRALVVNLAQFSSFVILILLEVLELGGGPGRLLLDVSKEPEEVLSISLQHLF